MTQHEVILVVFEHSGAPRSNQGQEIYHLKNDWAQIKLHCLGFWTKMDLSVILDTNFDPIHTLVVSSQASG